jgi:hypothetical protein
MEPLFGSRSVDGSTGRIPRTNMGTLALKQKNKNRIICLVINNTYVKTYKKKTNKKQKTKNKKQKTKNKKHKTKNTKQKTKNKKQKTTPFFIQPQR